MAGETKWTPGVWDWAPASEATDGRRSVLLSDARVFTVSGGTSRDIATVGIDRAAEANANARLFAAAPDLYAALDALRREYGQIVGPVMAARSPSFAEATRALAEARGES